MGGWHIDVMENDMKRAASVVEEDAEDRVVDVKD